MLAWDEAERQVADVNPMSRVVLEEAVGVVEEARSLADRGRERFPIVLLQRGAQVVVGEDHPALSLGADAGIAGCA